MGVLSTDDILRVLAWDTQDLVTTNAVERMVEGTRGGLEALGSCSFGTGPLTYVVRCPDG